MHANNADINARHPTDEELYAALCSTRRLSVLRHLRGCGGNASLSSLVEAVAAAETGKEPSELSQKERRRVYISLYQTHLPKLDEQDIISWDRDEDEIYLLVTGRLDGYLLEEATSVIAWDRYYLLLASVSLLLTALVTFNVSVFAATNPWTVGTLTVFTMFSLALVHRLND